ncbi:MAG TPA: malonyl-ACP O-methyltransferase BioC [Candidatus Saccharimonadia bacterium]|nr:malonyl-ACP O-methyltransferase BioC [Candidatus Saccharimonadia bacterium]
MAEPSARAPDAGDIDPRVVRRAFGRAAAGYDAAAVLQREVAARMLSRLDVVRLAPATILDAGCGTGECTGRLAARYPDARVVGIDFAQPMARAASERSRRSRALVGRLLSPILGRARGGPQFVCADLNALPFAVAAFDLGWSNLAFQWINDLPRAFAEMRRCLKVGALFTFSTFGPDTLKELRAAFARADGHPHVSRFADMHDIGDMLVAAGYADPVMDMEVITLTYADPRALMRELKTLGATNAARGRARGLTGRRRFGEVVAQLEARAIDGRSPATFEIVYGHAWKGEASRTADGLPVVRFARGRS